MIRRTEISMDTRLSIANSRGAVAKLGGKIRVESSTERIRIDKFALACASEMRYPKAGPAGGIR